MASIEKFEDMEAWQKARDPTREVYRVTNQRALARDFALGERIRRAAVSVMWDTGEGSERGGHREFRQFLAIAKGSAGEVKGRLYVAC